MESEVYKLKERLVEEMKNSKRAAEYGSELLQSNVLLKQANENLKAIHDKAVEDYRQQIHKLTSSLENKSLSLGQNESELESAREMSEELQRKVSKLEDSQRRTADLMLSKNNLAAECAEKGCELDAMRQRVGLLESQLCDAEARLQQSFAAESFTEPIEIKLLMSDNQTLLVTNRKLEEKVLELEENKIMGEKREQNLKCEYSKVVEELNDRDKALAEYSVQIHKAHVENEDLLAEVENLKMEQVDVQKRGNSLFSEVEDNRKALENEVKSLRALKKELQEKDMINVKEISLLKHRVTLLVNNSNQQGDTKSYIQKLKLALSQSRGEIQELNLRLEASEERRKVLENGSASKSPVVEYSSKDETYAFMNTRIFEKDKKLKELEQQLEALRFAKTSLNNELIQCNQQFYVSERKNGILKTDIMKLKLQLEALNIVDNSHREVSKPVTRVEKITGFGIKQVGTSKSVSPNTEMTISPKFSNTTETSSDQKNDEKIFTDTHFVNRMPLKRNLENVPVVDRSKSDCLEIKDSEVKKYSGKQAEVPCVLVTSEDAENINNCKQQ